MITPLEKFEALKRAVQFRRASLIDDNLGGLTPEQSAQKVIYQVADKRGLLPNSMIEPKTRGST